MTLFYQNSIRAGLALSFIFSLALLSACDSSAAKSEGNKQANVSVSIPTSTDNPKIVAFGDSLTAGFGLTEKESYPYLLQEKLRADGFDFEVVNAGVSGDTSVGGLERIEWSLEQENVKILILELGANDMLRGLSVERMKQNLDKIIKKAKARNVEVLLCGLFPPNQLVTKQQNEFAKAFQDLARENNVAFMPFFLENVGGVKTLNQPDGIHPNAEGTRIVADNVYRSLKPLLKK